MSAFKILGKLVATYFISLVVGLLALFIIMLPVGMIFFNGSTFDIVIMCVGISFLLPGFLCVFIFMPIAFSDKKMGVLNPLELVKRYMPMALIPVIILLLFLILANAMDGIGKCIFTYFYFLCMMALYIFCRAIKTIKQ